MACRAVAGLGCRQEALEAEVTLGKGGLSLGHSPALVLPVRNLQHAVGVGSAAAGELQMLLCRPAGEETRRAAGLLGCSGRAG